MATRKMRIVFLHPDLGIGGAERLVVDAALALKQCGHRVHIVTSHHDPRHAFPETVDGSLEVTVAGDRWLPRTILGRFTALCAYLRMIVATLWLIWVSDIDFDLIFADQVSASIPLIKWFSGFAKVVFYCHFPDQLLATGRDGLLKRLYRAPLDRWEEFTTGMADSVLVNSQFTEGVFRDTFPHLSRLPVRVLYPSIQCATFDRPPDGDLLEVAQLPRNVKTVFLSINRFERKKNLSLALRALAKLNGKINGDVATDIRKLAGSFHLIMCGGYDERLPENVGHYEELVQLAKELDIADQVTFLRSPSDARKQLLLYSCTAVLYTPEREHFGIVPLEAMYMSKAVIAVSSGGPLETVVDGETGFLCEADPLEFATAMVKLLRDRDMAREMGSAGRERVLKRFSYEAFRRELNLLITGIIDEID